MKDDSRAVSERHLRYENTAIPPAEQALEEGPRQRRRIECPGGAQFTVAVSRAHAPAVFRTISYDPLTVPWHSASSRQSIPAFGRPLLQGGTRLARSSILRGASDFYAPHHHFAFLISNFSFEQSVRTPHGANHHSPFCNAASNSALVRTLNFVRNSFTW